MHEVTCSCRGSGGKPANQPDARAIEDARKGVMEMSEEETKVEAATEVPMGHKIALRDIRNGEDIVKYGVVIGRATADIPAGSWVHLHVMRSVYDQRSSHLDVRTGAPKDTKYE